jgi:hypothetical protein
VVWRYEIRDDKWTKVPYDPIRRKARARADDPSTWGTLDEAWAAYSAGGWDGIGFEFAAEDPYFGVDVDQCLRNGQVLEWAAPILEELKSTYGEISPSGNGTKFLAKGKLPEKTGTRRSGMGPDGTGALELYDHGRFFTITGDRWGDADEIVDLPDVAVELYRLAKERPARPQRKPHHQGAAPSAPSSNGTHDDEEVLRLAGRSRDFDGLWRGNHTFGSQSEADLSLCGRLAYYCGPGQDDQVKRLFLQSALGKRGKATDRTDYVPRTVAKAYEGRTEYFDWRPRSKPSRNGRHRPSASGAASQGLPEIVCASDDQSEGLKRWTPLALDALARANRPNPKIYQKGGLLVRVRDGDPDAPHVIEPLCVDSLRGVLDRSACWAVEVPTKKGSVLKYGPPKLEIVRDILALPAYDEEGFPILEAIVEAPRYMPNGELILTAGYHAPGRLLYAPAADLIGLTIPKAPGDDHVNAAKQLLLDELLVDFPFADAASRANALALMLLPFAREMIEGPTPNHHVTASTEGTGKGLCATACSFPALGREIDLTPQKEDEAEWRKALTSAFMSGASHLLIDNMYNPLGWEGMPLAVDSGTLAMAWTARHWRDRILGGNKEARVKIRTIFVSTGNNVTFSRELERRIVPIELLASIENPSLRTGFRHDPLLDWARENRRALVEACLTLCQRWIVAGMPPGNSTMGSYESYARTMGGILAACGVSGFLANRSRRAVGLSQSDRWSALITEWRRIHGVKLVSTAQLWELIRADDALAERFHEVIGESTVNSQKTRLGRGLEAQAKRVFGDWRVVRSSARAANKGVLWRLQPKDQPVTDDGESEPVQDDDVLSPAF